MADKSPRRYSYVKSDSIFSVVPSRPYILSYVFRDGARKHKAKTLKIRCARRSAGVSQSRARIHLHSLRLQRSYVRSRRWLNRSQSEWLSAECRMQLTLTTFIAREIGRVDLANGL